MICNFDAACLRLFFSANSSFSSHEGSITVSVINGALWDAQTYITVKENTVSKIVATLNRIAESSMMEDLQAILA